MEPEKIKRLDFKQDEFPQPEYIPLKYPILLCHGFGAILSMLLPSPLHHPCMFLREHGIVAFAPNIAPYVSLEVGAAAWVKIIGKVIRMTGSPKVNVIAHSMAGLSLRYAIHKVKLAGTISSLTTVASPHHGTSLATMAIESPKQAFETFQKLSDYVGNKIYPTLESDVMGAIKQLTPDYVAKFNREITDVRGVSYYSVSAASGKETENNIGLIMIPYNRYIYAREGQNDGFVSERSAHWGRHIGFTNLSHLGQLNVNLPKKYLKNWETLWMDIVKNLSNEGH
ncbi:MAG: hypothetical protein WD267_01560 [Balneolales bacterium]